MTLVWLDASTPSGFVRTALRDATGADLFPVADGFFRFVVPASQPLTRIELRPRLLSAEGVGTESFTIHEMLGSIRILSVPEPGSAPLWGLGLLLLHWACRREPVPGPASPTADC